MSTEVFQLCIYCSVDVIKGDSHDEDCPDVTGFFPVTERDVEQEFSCGCGHFFEVGEYYTDRRTEEYFNPFDTTFQVSPTCLDCALIDLKEAA
jgi:hypothetical protein